MSSMFSLLLLFFCFTNYGFSKPLEEEYISAVASIHDIIKLQRLEFITSYHFYEFKNYFEKKDVKADNPQRYVYTEPIADMEPTYKVLNSHVDILSQNIPAECLSSYTVEAYPGTCILPPHCTMIEKLNIKGVVLCVGLMKSIQPLIHVNYETMIGFSDPVRKRYSNFIMGKRLYDVQPMRFFKRHVYTIPNYYFRRINVSDTYDSILFTTKLAKKIRVCHYDTTPFLLLYNLLKPMYHESIHLFDVYHVDRSKIYYGKCDFSTDDYCSHKIPVNSTHVVCSNFYFNSLHGRYVCSDAFLPVLGKASICHEVEVVEVKSFFEKIKDTFSFDNLEKVLLSVLTTMLTVIAETFGILIKPFIVALVKALDEALESHAFDELFDAVCRILEAVFEMAFKIYLMLDKRVLLTEFVCLYIYFRHNLHSTTVALFCFVLVTFIFHLQRPWTSIFVFLFENKDFSLMSIFGNDTFVDI